MKALLNETYGCRFCIMELPFFEVGVFCRPGGVCFYIEVVQGLCLSISFGTGI